MEFFTCAAVLICLVLNINCRAKSRLQMTLVTTVRWCVFSRPFAVTCAGWPAVWTQLSRAHVRSSCLVQGKRRGTCCCSHPPVFFLTASCLLKTCWMCANGFVSHFYVFGWSAAIDWLCLLVSGDIYLKQHAVSLYNITYWRENRGTVYVCERERESRVNEWGLGDEEEVWV